MLLPWLYFIFIFLIMTLFWLMLCCLVAGLCRTVFRLLLVCSLKWPKMLQILKLQDSCLSSGKCSAVCPGPSSHNTCIFMGGHTLMYFVDVADGKPTTQYFQTSFPCLSGLHKGMVSSRGMQAQVTERLHTAARPLKRAAKCWTGSSLSWLAVIKASVFTLLLCLTTASFLISVSLREICEMQSSSFYLDRRITGPWVL